MGLISEFKVFINRGNVLDLAVGVIIGAAFSKIVTALTDDFITPILSLATGGFDFTHLYLAAGRVPANAPATLAGMKAAGVPVFAYGHFITAVIDFLIVAFVIFLIVRIANKALSRSQEAVIAEEVALLREIRDVLKSAPSPRASGVGSDA